MTQIRTEIRAAAVPAVLLLAVGWYGCAPHAGPETDEPEQLESSPAVEPEPGRTTRVLDDPPDEAVAPIVDPPADAPKVASVSVFDVLARDAKRPTASDNNEIDWFLGSSSPNPSWSPDGERIAHYDGECVTIRDSHGKSVGSLRTRIDKAECRAPRWSPNGRKIVTSHTFHGPGVLFDVRSRKSQRLGGTDEGLWSLQFVDDAGVVGRVHQSGAVLVDLRARTTSAPLVTDAMPAMGGYFPTVAPGGTRMARVLGDWQGPGELEIARIDLGAKTRVPVQDPWDEGVKHAGFTGTRELVVNGPILEYAWSGDGQRIAAIRSPQWYPGYGNFDYGFGALVVVDVATADVRVVAQRAKNPTWSPDGRFVAFESELGGIWLHELKDGGATWLLHDVNIEPQWSPSGDAILTLDPKHQQGVVLHLVRP